MAKPPMVSRVKVMGSGTKTLSVSRAGFMPRIVERLCVTELDEV